MGLDIVELVLAVEETFEIRLDNEMLLQCYAAGDLYNLVLARVRATHRPVSVIPARRAACAGTHAYY